MSEFRFFFSQTREKTDCTYQNQYISPLLRGSKESTAVLFSWRWHVVNYCKFMCRPLCTDFFLSFLLLSLKIIKCICSLQGNHSLMLLETISLRQFTTSQKRKLRQKKSTYPSCEHKSTWLVILATMADPLKLGNTSSHLLLKAIPLLYTCSLSPTLSLMASQPKHAETEQYDQVHALQPLPTPLISLWCYNNIELNDEHLTE